MKLRLLYLVGSLAIVICVASIAAWIGLGRTHPGFSISTKHTQFEAMALERAVVVELVSVPWPVPPAFEIQSGTFRIYEVTPDPSDVGDSIYNGRHTTNAFWEFHDLSVAYRVYPYASRSGRAPYRLIEAILGVPYWLIVIVSIGAIALCIRAIRRRRLHAERQAKNLCRICGYDLRATPDRCPECGTVP